MRNIDGKDSKGTINDRMRSIERLDGSISNNSTLQRRSGVGIRDLAYDVKHDIVGDIDRDRASPLRRSP